MTKVYGCSDDLIEIDGDVSGEINHMSDRPARIHFSDGTVLSVVYGKPENDGVWWIRNVKAGPLFERIDECFDDKAEIYSDVAYFREGLIHARYQWKKVS